MQKLTDYTIVFFVYNIYGIGGTVRATVNSANHLSKKGYAVTIISMRKTAETPALFISSAIKLFPLQDYTCSDNSDLLHLIKRKFLQRLPSKIIHKDEDLYGRCTAYTDLTLKYSLNDIPQKSIIVSTVPSLTMFLAENKSKLTDVRIIAQEHKNFKMHARNLQEAALSAYAKSDAIMTLFKSDENFYKKLPSTVKILNQPNAVELPTCKTENFETKTIISLGRLHKDKRLDILIRAFSEVVKSYPDWVLKIYGEGKEKRILQEQIDDLRLSDHIFLESPTADVTKIYQESSIFATTSKNEGFGLTIAEAMAHKIPTISFDVPTGPRVLLAENRGILVPEGHENEYSKLLKLMISEKKLPDTDAAFDYVKSNFNQTKIGNQFIANLESILN